MLRRLGLGLLLLGALPSVLPAQYFGQNKVQYRKFDFQILKTEHFDIHFYPEARQAAFDAGRMAERSYAILSKVLRHEYRERKPIILYASHSDFQQTNALGGESPGEGTGGVTDFLKQRIILPFTGSYEELEHVLQHEMVHQFQYDIWSRGRAGANIQAIIQVNPPLWFVEGMAEYLSLGGVDPNTAMWLRDAAIEGKIPTVDQLENDPYIFPYRYGQALLAFIGQRWGDEAIGAIMQGTLAGGGGLRGAMRRVLGVDYPQLSALWRQHIQETYLPEVATRTRARDIAREVLSQDRSEGTLHLAPALSPDGQHVAYFSEKDFYFIDLYLADAATGKVERRLSKSSYSSNYETFRFINSQANWSPDGQFLAFAAKRGPRDDIIILDVRRNREVRRIEVKMNGVTTPSWSPDGKSLVFTGYVGGLSDLFIVGADGKGLRRLTDDRYADLHPVWSPDGTTIAFASDRGPDTDFGQLKIGNMRICTLDLATGLVTVLPGMDVGKNVSPQWGPDGRDIAFVSDRDGVSNIFLYSLDDTRIYQITDLFTGAQGITPLSPVLSWAQGADRLAFVYYTRDMFDVYAIDHPGSLKTRAWEPKAQPTRRDVATLGPRLRPQAGDSARPPADTLAAPDTAAARNPLESSGSLYISPTGIRSADSAPAVTDTLLRPVTITALLDSTNVPLPDTAEFVVKDYKVQFRPDFVSRPTIGYTRDNFGRGFYGGSAIQLSDMLGNHNLIFAAFINGRITEAMVNATYINMERRVNWAVSAGQEPYYFLEPSYIVADSPQVGDRVFVTNLRRIVLRSVQAQALYPVSRFARFEAGMTAATISDRLQSIYEPYDAATGLPVDNAISRERGLPGASYVEPELAYVFDNSLPGYVGPFYGRRYRLSVSQTIGGWRFFQGLADYRRYDKIVGPLVFATRGLYFGRIGRDADRFRIFLGNPDLLRGNTSGSYYNHECTTQDPNTTTGCVELDRLVGTQIAVGSAEIRFPILTPQFKFVPAGFPPIEGALFYDVGLAWNEGNTLKWKREPGDDPVNVRTPLQVFGASARMNLFGFVVLRLDYSIPQERRAIKGYWTLSLGPAF